MRQIQSAALPEWQLPPNHPPLAPRDRPDAFLRAIPDAALDICLILRNSAVAAPLDALQRAMRGFCTLPWPISHATLGPGRLDLRIDDTQLVFGSFPLPTTAAFFRPDMAGASRATGRLGHLLNHHDMVLRLRIAISATTEMLAAIRHLLLNLTRPKAVIALPQWLVLSLSEFERLSSEAPDQPLLAIPLPRRTPRHTRLRPRDPGAEPPQQPPTARPQRARACFAAGRTGQIPNARRTRSKPCSTIITIPASARPCAPSSAPPPTGNGSPQGAANTGLHSCTARPLDQSRQATCWSVMQWFLPAGAGPAPASHRSCSPLWSRFCP